MLATIVRLVVLLVGITLAMVCVKFAALAIRHGEAYRAWGLASYGLLVFTPAIISLYRFDLRVLWFPLVLYAAGLVCGIIALRSVYTINTDWTRLMARDRTRKRIRHIRGEKGRHRDE